MIRGTTEQFQFKIPYKYEEVEYVEITFLQEDVFGTADAPFPIKKYLNACDDTTGTNILRIVLHPNETMRFIDTKKAFVQLVGRTFEGNVFSHRKHQITVYPVCSDHIFAPISPPVTDDGWLIIDGGVIVDGPGGNIILDGGSILE